MSIGGHNPKSKNFCKKVRGEGKIYYLYANFSRYDLMKHFFPFIVLLAITLSSIPSCQQAPMEIPVSSISFAESKMELTVGEQIPLDPVIIPDNATNKRISWSSSKDAVATVTTDGIVEAISAGTAFITATSEDSGVNAKCEILVKEKVVAVTGIALNKTSVSLSVGEEFTLMPTITPDNATNKDVEWKSDNEAVASVSSEGVVKALRAGKANITATTVDQAKTAACAVEVKEGMGAVTGEASHISCRNAQLSGKVNLPQTTSTNLSFGVLYSTSSGVLLNSAIRLEAKQFDAEYNFTVETGVLEPETIYYYRSYIIQNDEVEYGQIQSFTTLAVSSLIQTLDAGSINPKDATLNASLNLTDCRYGSLEYGFKLTPEGGQTRTLISDNHADNVFSFRADNLTYKTKYSYAAYVKLDDKIYKGESKTFSTLLIQASVTAEVSDVKCNSAKISGSLNVQSEGSFRKSAVLYFSSSESTLEGLRSNGTTATLTLGSDGSYSETLSSLTSSTAYNFVVVAKVDDVEFASQIGDFSTLSIQASVTAEASDVKCNSATISGSLDIKSEGVFSKSAVLYFSSSESTLEGLRSNGTTATLTLGSDGSYSETLSSLTSSTAYNFVVVAKVDDVEFASQIGDFSTLSIQASVTAEASDVKCNSATISGSLDIKSEGVFSKSAVLYFSSSESTLEGLRSNGTTATLTLGSDGSYSETLSSLTSSTAYNFVVVAKVDDVEFASQIGNFSTLLIQASVTAEASDVKFSSAKISGSLNIQSEGSFRKSAVLYYSSSKSTLEGLRSKGTKVTLTLGSDGSYSETLSSLTSSTAYNFVVVAKVDDVEFSSQIGNFSTLELPAGAVDLGLSVCWASCNLGASKPTEYGGYYQWAGTTDVSDTGIYLYWSNCPYHTGSDEYSGWSKYNTKSSYGTVDNKTVLEAKDDAATVLLGGNWRIPTDAEWAELRNTANCSWTWTTIDGVSGYKVQSKKSGYTDKWIFLPAAGLRDGGMKGGVGSSGFYWSSSLDTDAPFACGMCLHSSDVYRGYIHRYVGQSVRPVSE